MPAIDPTKAKVKTTQAKTSRAKTTRAGATQTKAKSGKPARTNTKRNPPKAKAKEERLEQQIEAAEAALRAVEDELADPAAWSSPGASARSTQRHEEAKRAVAELYDRWETVAG